MAKEKAKGGPQPAQRLPGAEDACISQEQLEIVEWYRKVKFRKNLLGGVEEAGGALRPVRKRHPGREGKV